jgi:hypothetical protein
MNMNIAAWPIGGFPRVAQRATAVLLGLVVIFGIAGCGASPVITSGERPRTEKLSTLVSGKSTAAEVRAALGVPRGYGLMRHRPEVKLRKIWFYEMMQSKTDQSSLYVLLVYLDEKGEFYDGYFWFRGNAFLSNEAP